MEHVSSYTTTLNWLDWVCNHEFAVSKKYAG